jgi:hypothetical protein
MAAMSSLVVGRTGFFWGMVVVVVGVDLVQCVTLVEGAAGEVVGVGVTDMVGMRGVRGVLLVVDFVSKEGGALVVATVVDVSRFTMDGTSYTLSVLGAELVCPASTLCSVSLTNCGSRLSRYCVPAMFNKEERSSSVDEVLVLLELPTN